ncbi:MAG: 4-(cytidine 5'-diphospho)-2-C-methyl-D-erythritol kinase [Actinomycetota bacterium]
MGATADISTGLRLRTNAKLNLFLRVLGRRGDGYHELESIFHTVALGDDLLVVPTSSGEVDIDMRLEGAVGAIPEVHENLVSIAAQRLIERGATNGGIAVEIVKRIPFGAGLGGGSGNAAGILVALNELWDMRLTNEDLQQVAGLVGSDVPFCLGGGTALATARGEQLTQLPSPISMDFVLGISNEPLSTRDVYDAWDDITSEEEISSAPMALALGSGEVEEVASLLHNDLEPASFGLRPELGDLKDAMGAAGALGAAMSGSGPTIFGIARSPEHATEIAERVRGDFDRVEVVESIERCVERLT